MLGLSSQRTRGRMHDFVSTADAGISSSPSAIAGIQLWLKADTIALTDGAAIASWPDESGNGRNATQGDSSKRPIFKTGSFESGAPGVRFDGVDDFLTLGNISAAFPAAATVFVAAKITSTNPYSLYETASGADGYWKYDATHTYIAAFRASRLFNVAWTLPSSGTHVFALTSSSSTYSLVIDGGTAQTATAAYSSGNSHFIGCNPTSPFAFLAGDIGEVLVYNSALTNSDRMVVEAYLKLKYATM